MRNFGQHNALMCGFRHARGDFVITMDDDLQNPPEEIPKLLDAIQSGGFDLVYGTYRRRSTAAGAISGSALVNAFYRLTFRTDVTITSFRIIRRQLLREHLFLRPELHVHRRPAGLEHPADRRRSRSSTTRVRPAAPATILASC